MANEELVKAVRALEKEDGRLQPADLVEAARDPASPLHSYFEWDDTEAAIKYRLSQARALIRTVRVEITVRETPLIVPSYVRDPDSDRKQAGYRNVVHIRNEKDSARAVVIDEMKRVSSAAYRAKNLAALLGVEDDVDEISALARSVSARVSDDKHPETH